MNFRYEDVPHDKTIFQYIRENSDWDEQVSKFAPRYEPELRIENMEFDPDAFSRELAHHFHKVGLSTWQSRPEAKNAITGGCLTYNPAHPKERWNIGSFGHSRYQEINTTDYFGRVSIDMDNAPRDDYLDILSFRNVNPVLYETAPSVVDFLTELNFPVVYSTVRTLNGCLAMPTRFSSPEGGMHVDHSPFVGLRINICVSNDGNYGLQYQNGATVYSKPGDNLVVNADIKHRVFIKDWNQFNRTNLIFSILPWLDYDWVSDSWSFNEYYGKLHPYDMVREGLIYG